MRGGHDATSGVNLIVVKRTVDELPLEVAPKILADGHPVPRSRMPDVFVLTQRSGPATGGKQPYARVEYVQDQAPIRGEMSPDSAERAELVLAAQVVQER